MKRNFILKEFEKMKDSRTIYNFHDKSLEVGWVKDNEGRIIRVKFEGFIRIMRRDDLEVESLHGKKLPINDNVFRRYLNKEMNGRTWKDMEIKRYKIEYQGYDYPEIVIVLEFEGTDIPIGICEIFVTDLFRELEKIPKKYFFLIWEK